MVDSHEAQTNPIAPVLVGEHWRKSAGDGSFAKRSPETDALLGEYPISPWSEVDEALGHAAAAYDEMAAAGPAVIADFVERFADRLEARSGELVKVANAESALPAIPRLQDVELPRTTGQLRAAAAAARDRTWKQSTISPRHAIASYLAPVPGVVAVFGPNNFPFAFNSVSGGDAAAAIASGHPILAKANPGHPETTRLLAVEAREAAIDVGLPPTVVQLIYRTTHADGKRLVADPRTAATAYTGSRTGGLALKEAADRAGKPIYLEMSSINPVVVLPGALRQRGSEIAEELAVSALTGVGQFCTSPGLLVLPFGEDGDSFIDVLSSRYTESPGGVLLDSTVRARLEVAQRTWQESGAQIVAAAVAPPGPCRFPTTVMKVDAGTFLQDPLALQTEAFGNMILIVQVPDTDGYVQILRALEGNLTGSIYSDDSDDERAYEAVVHELRPRVGRLLDDKVPTGVAVVPAMNHGGPYPSTGHPGFTAVGLPASMHRFGMLQCFDAVRPHRLPMELQPENPLDIQRFVDGVWTSEQTPWN